MTRAWRVAYWLAPLALCLALYRLGLRVWFMQDDFAWLMLRNHAVDFHNFLWALFAPMAQGTIRIFSERVFFMAFSYVFGLHPMPYRVFVFLNQLVNVALVMLVARKLTRSELASFLAPVLWLANPVLVMPMIWTSSYNEIQCATFLLLSFYLFLRYTETGERKFYWLQWTTFVLGFGSLEINIVYPAIATWYAILFARRYFLGTLPLFGGSAVFAALHRLAGNFQQGFYYDLDFHPGPVLNTLVAYWNILLGVPAYVSLRQRPDWWGVGAVLLLTAVILGFVAWQSWKRRLLPLFLLGWFVIVLSPLLPLHNHVSDYYLFIPAIGMSILAAHAIAQAWRSGPAPVALAAILALLYAVPSATAGQAGMRYYFARAERVRALVQSVAYAKHIHPGKTILLRDVDDALFWSAVYDSPFHIFGWYDVFLTPDTREQIREDKNLNPIDAYFLPASAVSRVLNDQAAEVYAVEKQRLRNVTRMYTILLNAQPEPELASSVDAGTAYFDDQLGAGWYHLENGFRWCGPRAVVYLHGPTSAAQKLLVHGFAPESQTRLGAVHLALTVNGEKEPVQTLDRANSEFRLQYDLPANVVGQPKIEVTLTVDRTVRAPGDPRDLGLVFGDFSIR
ncbi:MAG TPA: hypothetical protein VEV17_01480 [Bryobacteraceae bacterium]|nr:hypothetical protein [Bryobacteraceae bacterium]